MARLYEDVTTIGFCGRSFLGVLITGGDCEDFMVGLFEIIPQS